MRSLLRARCALGIAAALVMLAVPPAALGATVALHSTPADAFVDPNGTPVPLNGFNVTPVWNDSVGNTWGKAKYDEIRSKGFNAARFVLKWSDFEPTNRGGFNQTALATLDTAVARAKAAGLYVILDCIHLVGSGGMSYVPTWARTGDSVTTVQTNGGGYLKALASRYSNEPAVAAYDLVSEPYRWPLDQNSVLRMYDALIKQVRTVDVAKIVVIEPTYGDTSIAGALADFSNLSTKTNVVWSIHDYFAGGDDDGYRADGAQAGTWTWSGKGYPAPNLQQLDNHVFVQVSKTRLAGIPMWIGEYGIADGSANHDQWIKDTTAVFAKYRLGRAWWEYYTTGGLSATTSAFAWKPWVGLIVPGATAPPPPPDTTAPAAPAGVTATAGDAQVLLGWRRSPESDVAGYRVYRRNADGTWPAAPSATTSDTGWTDTARANGTTYTYRLTAYDTSGNASVPSAAVSATPVAAPQPTVTATPTATTTPTSHVITAVGDYTSSSSNANDIAVKNVVVAANPEIHLGIGDFQYTYISAISSGFDVIWGPKPNGLWPRIRPTGGPTHDATSCSDVNYQNYWLRPVMKGYSFDVGSWHIISLPSSAYRYGCDTAGILAWLKADLAASTASCTLAFWQDPYFTRPTATHSAEQAVKPWVDALYAANADVILQASNHDYQRFAKQDPARNPDPARGLRAFVVGTGGIGLYAFTGAAPNVEASDDKTYGALKMALRPGGYDFQFIRAAGGTFTDSGSGTCH